MIILWNNRIDEAVISVTSENPNYPAENLQHIHKSKIYRSVDDAAQGVVINLAGCVASYVALLGHNLSSVATITLQGNSSNSWSAPAFSETIPWRAENIVHTFTEHTYAYWRLYINDDNSDGYIEIARPYLGTYLAMPDFDRKYSLPFNTTATVDVSDSGQPYGDEGYDYYNFSVNYPCIYEAQRQEIETMFRAVKNIKPVILIPWESEDLVLYMRINQNKLNWAPADGNVYDWQLPLEFMEAF